jgi:hypothetical protein
MAGDRKGLASFYLRRKKNAGAKKALEQKRRWSKKSAGE